MDGKLLYKDESYAINGACYEVCKTLGCGFLEPVYQECLEIELAKRGIPFVPQKPLTLTYAGQVLTQKYRPDLISYDTIIVEVKAVSRLSDEHRLQVMNYLKATSFRLGLLYHFGHHPLLEKSRLINTT